MLVNGGNGLGGFGGLITNMSQSSIAGSGTGIGGNGLNAGAGGSGEGIGGDFSGAVGSAGAGIGGDGGSIMLRPTRRRNRTKSFHKRRHHKKNTKNTKAKLKNALSLN